MGRAPNWATSQWARQRNSSDWWDEKAQCARRPDLPWAGDNAPTPPQHLEMANICGGCPEIKACARRGLEGADGGFHAGVWLPWPSENRNAKEKRRLAMVRLRAFVMREKISAVR